LAGAIRLAELMPRVTVRIGRRRSFCSFLPLLIVVYFVGLAGCASVDRPYLLYKPMPERVKVARPNTPPVALDVSDKRANKIVMSEPIDAFGPTQEFEAYNDIPEMLRGAFEEELRNRGFTLNSGGDVVSVTLSFYQSDWLRDSVVGTAVASIGLDVAVKHTDGSGIYRRFILGQSQPWQKIHPPEENFKYPVTNALQAAMQDALAKVFSDPSFINALSGARPTPPGARAVPSTSRTL
jgi:hypothetical protein